MTVFEKRKIKRETLSEYLVSVRTQLKLLPEAVSQQTGIKLNFLLALESGNFKLLPADVYVLGFLRQLSQVYGVDKTELINQYKKEREIQQNILKQPSLLNVAWYKKYFSRLVVTPKSLSMVFGIAFVALSLGYIIFQLWSINKIPVLAVTVPQNNAVIQGGFVVVSGKTDPGSNLTVNAQNIFVDSQGQFSTQVSLSPGPKEIVISASNRFGKTISKTLNITGVAAENNPTAGLELKLDFSGVVKLNFAIDDQPSQPLDFNSGDSKTFIARQKVVISTSDAGATRVTFNGQSLGLMGRAKEALSNIAFFLQADNGNK